MNLNELKSKIDKLIEQGKGDLEIYDYDKTSMYAKKINNIEIVLLYNRDLYLTDRENYKYRSMNELDVDIIFNNGEEVIKFY